MEGRTSRCAQRLNWHVSGRGGRARPIHRSGLRLAHPALQSTQRADGLPALKESRTGNARGRGLRGLSLSRILIVSQLGFTLLILVAASLFLRTLRRIWRRFNLGFSRENVLTFQVERPARPDTPTRRLSLFIAAFGRRLPRFRVCCARQAFPIMLSIRNRHEHDSGCLRIGLQC